MHNHFYSWLHIIVTLMIETLGIVTLRSVTLRTSSLILTNIPRSPLRPVLIHPGLVLKNNKSAAYIVVPPLQSRPSAFSEAGKPAAQHKAQYDTNGHADEEPSQYPLSAVAPLGNVSY